MYKNVNKFMKKLNFLFNSLIFIFSSFCQNILINLTGGGSDLNLMY